jgi:hypothetical protein
LREGILPSILRAVFMTVMLQWCEKIYELASEFLENFISVILYHVVPLLCNDHEKEYALLGNGQ